MAIVQLLLSGDLPGSVGASYRWGFFQELLLLLLLSATARAGPDPNPLGFCSSVLRSLGHERRSEARDAYQALQTTEEYHGQLQLGRLRVGRVTAWRVPDTQTASWICRAPDSARVSYEIMLSVYNLHS